MRLRKEPKEIAVLTLLGTASLAACFFLWGSKDRAFGRRFIEDQANAHGPDGYATDGFTYGDLYRYAEVGPLPRPIKMMNDATSDAGINDAQVLMFGDSFTTYGMDSRPLPFELEKASGIKTFNAGAADFWLTDYLGSHAFDPQHHQAKVAVVETVERNIFRNLDKDGFSGPLDGTEPASFGQANIDQAVRGSPLLVTLRSWVSGAFYQGLGQAEVEYFIKRNRFVDPFRRWLKEIAFRYFGDLDTNIGAYSSAHQMFFYRDEVEFARDAAKLTQAEMDRLADRIDMAGKTLREKYGLKMVLAVMPDKYTVYRDYLPDVESYDGFLPQLQAALKKRGVDYIDMYSVERQMHAERPDLLLYYPSDTHYNVIGKKLLIDRLKDYLQ